MLFQFESDKLDKAPCGMALLEGSYCEKTLVLRTSRDTRIAPQHDHCFTICCLPKRKKYYELRADSEEKCDDWVAAIRGASFDWNAQNYPKVDYFAPHLQWVGAADRMISLS
uniref:Ras specific guanine nucleotide releasing factor n=1 Tax=Echinococcus granulosus TaxID=6210 RepID=A0A068X024_ECHGR|nr:ras specific guanine nucleotide releasing factor [Echinococcus granulosus]